ncbi:MAG: hypothetical protein A2V88_12000 [Elusimicrobia bacterium RBG_16_66_12]|nr:MAG: hypothetical protein A2V88_12000 [Elusimicrobia bacterium RBG_16_66_12]
MKRYQTPLVIAACLWAGLIVVNAVVLGRRLTLSVKTATVKNAPMALIVRAPGILQPATNALIKAEFDGPIVKKIYKEGDRVRAGQRLLEIGRDSIRMQYMGKDSEFKNAQRELKKAVGELKLQKTLFKKKAVAFAAVDEAANALERARQAVEIASTAFSMEQSRWNKNIVFAPFSGTVTKDYLGQEAAVGAGKELLSLGDLSSYAMQVKVDELGIAQIQIGQPAVVRLQAFENMPLKARVAKIGAQSDEKGMAQYAVSLAIAPESSTRLPLMPQFSGEGRIHIGTTAPVLSAPLTALSMKGGKQIVWAVNALGRLEARAVEVGKSNADEAEITAGLAEGDRICVAAAPSFTEGMRVKTHE